MKNFSRYILVFITVISLSIILPSLYWLSFEKPIGTPFVMYSCVDDNFVMRSFEDGKSTYKNEFGEEFSRDEYEQKIPLLNFRQLLISETLPDSIKGVEMDMHLVSAARSFFRYKPRKKNAPKAGLYPLFESKSGRAKLSMPLDFFRINSRMEFLISEGNKIDEKKTVLFTTELQKSGFKFPAKSIDGIPTTRKSCDEGYFVVDSDDQLFHIKLIETKPYVRHITIPKGLTFKHIACVDFRNKEYYCYLIGHDNSIFIVTQGDYVLERLPVDGFDADKQELRIYCDLFNYNVILMGKNHIKVVALDDNLNYVAEFNKTWTKRSLKPEGKVFSYLFPIQLQMKDRYSSFINFYVYPTQGFNWMILHVLLLLSQFLIIRKRNANPKNHLIDFGIVLVGGLFGFLAVNIFPNKFFD